MKKTLLFSSLILILVLSACAASAQATSAPSVANKNMSGGASAPVMEAPAAPAPSSDMAAPASGGGQFGNASAVPEVKQLIIITGEMTLVVADPVKSMTDIKNAAESLGGNLTGSNLYQTTTDSGVEVPYATITISIPAEKLDEALAKIKAMVADPKKDILSEKMSSQNVTKEYVDLDSRLKNLEKADERLTSIMAQAVKTEDVLAVYNQLTQVEEQMEVIKGQMKYYEQSAANSTLTINLQAQETIKPVTVAGWEPTGVARDAVQALLNTLKVIANIAIWLIIYILPLGVILALIILFIRWLWPKVFKPRKRAMPPLPPMMPPAPPAA